MNFDSVREQIAGTFKTRFTLAHPSTAIKFENQKFVQPRGAPWVDFRIIPNVSRPAALGDKTYFHYGCFNINIMVPEDTGTKVMNDMAQTVFDILANDNWQLPSGGYLTTYGIARKPRGTINGFYVMSVEAEFRHQGKKM